MARPEKKVKTESTKRKKGEKRPQKKWVAYLIDGGSLKRKNRSCPKCGDGVWLANHRDRLSCGRCGYTEFVKKT